MAERKPIGARSVSLPAVSSSIGGNPIASEVAEFGNRLTVLSKDLTESWVKKREREEFIEGTKSGAAGPITPDRSGTRAAEAYNEGAFRSYFENLKITAADRAQQLFDENKDDPDKLENALTGYRQGIEAELNKSTPELLPGFQATFDRIARPFRRKAADDYQLRQDQQALANVSAALVTKSRQGERRAFLAGDDPGALADIAADRGDWLESLIQSGPKTAFELNGKQYAADPKRDGLAAPEELRKQIQQYDQSIIESRYMGQGQRAIRAGRGDRAILSVANSSKALADLGLDGRDRVTSWLRGQLSLQEGARAATDKVLASQVNAFINAVGGGRQVGGGDELLARAKGTEYEAPLRLALQNQDILTDFTRLTPAQQQAEMARQSEALAGVKPDSPDYATEVRARDFRLDRMTALHDQTRKALKEDAFGFAQAIGVIPEQPPLTNEQGLLNPAAFKSRLEASRTVDGFYGLPQGSTAPLAREEGAALAQALITGGVSRMAGGLVSADPAEHAAVQQAIRVMEPDFPEVAQIATFAMNDRVSPEGRNVAALLERGYALTRKPEKGEAPFKLKAGQDGRTGFEEEFNEYTGDAFLGNAGARQRAMDGVLAVYASLSESTAEGLTGNLNEDTFKAAAKTYFGGGLVKINGGKVFAPYGMGEDEFEAGLMADARAKLAGTYSPAQVEAVLRNAKPQHTANGYMLVTDDSFVAGPDGQPMEFQPTAVPVKPARQPMQSGRFQ